MNALERFNELTLQILEILTNPTKADRDSNIKKIDEFLNQRDELIGSIRPPFSEEERNVGMKLIELNKQVNILLNLQKKEIQLDMKNLKAKKNSTAKYSNPYENISVDGAFYDKKN